MPLDNKTDYWRLTDEQTQNLTDMVYAIINRVAKYELKSDTDDSRDNIGADLTNIPYVNPYHISDILQTIGYESDTMDRNGWEMDYWEEFTHSNPDKFPPMECRRTAILHAVYLIGNTDDENNYLVNGHSLLELDPEIAPRIKHGEELLEIYSR